MSSSLPGGPSAKAGLIYETFYGIRAMLSIILGSADTITIEPPHQDGCEFFLEGQGVREYWQVKRQCIGQSWTLRKMNDERVLSAFLEYLRRGYSCCFASMTEAQELRLLVEHARNARDLEAFKRDYLNDEQQKLFKRLLNYWPGVSEAEALDLLRRIFFEGGQERTLEKDLGDMLKAIFDVTPAQAQNCLFCFYLTAVHQRLSREHILAHLNAEGIKPRTECLRSSYHQQLASITDQYIAGQKAKLIGRKAIPRGVAKEIVEKLQSTKVALDLAVAGGAGAGKSACLLQILEQLQSAGTPLLAFRLDTLQPCATSLQVGQQLGLPESPIVVFARAFAGKRAVVVLDQLDVVSSASGRHPEFFDTVAHLIEEIRGCRLNCDLSLMVACREFDLSSDPRLRRLFKGDQWLYNLSILSAEEVSTVLVEQRVAPALLTKGQLDLLRLPQNLYLFIESGLARRPEVQFKSQKELLDLFWEVKVNEVSSKNSSWFDLVNSLVGTLSEEISRTQQLSVPRSKLQRFPPSLVSAGCSAGFLTSENGRIAFSHESLFDYVFAKGEIANGRNFVKFLEGDPQLLFRRGQLRQVLIFLRDDDFTRYIGIINDLLGSDRIRFHLKLLSLQLLAGLPDPTKEEFMVFLPLIEREFANRKLGNENSDALSRQALEQFFHSKGLFVPADAEGRLQTWLQSSEPSLKEIMWCYFQRQSPWHSNRIAQLLLSFEMTRDSESRFRGLFQYAALHFSEIQDGREFFDFFLRSVDRGVFDPKEGNLSREDFFGMLHDLGKAKPKLYAEISSRWLSRQVDRLSALPRGKIEMSLDAIAYSDDLIESAKSDPEGFLRCVLPVMLRAAQVCARNGDRKYKRDTIWKWRCITDYQSLAETYRRACEVSLEILAKQGEVNVRSFLEILKDTTLDVANSLLLHVYTTRPKIFADEGIRALVLDPDRLYAGYSDSPFWTSRTMIKECSPWCSQDLFEKLEDALLKFITPAEKGVDALGWRGESAYTFLSALPRERMSLLARQRLDALQAKFGGIRPPRGVRSYNVVSPIKRIAAEKMNDEQWLRAIAKYNGRCRDFSYPEKGGAEHLAAMLQDFVKFDPQRYGALSLRFPRDTDPYYFMNVLLGLKESAAPFALKIEVVRRSLLWHQDFCAWSALDLLSSLADEELPDDMISFVAHTATSHPDPDAAKETEGSSGELSTKGRNTTRGHAAWAIATLIRENPIYLARFEPAIEDLILDGSLSVRACAMVILFSIAEVDQSKAKALFQRLVGPHDRLLATDHGDAFLRYFIENDPDFIKPYFQRMIASENREIQEAGGRLAALAGLFHSGFELLIENAVERGAASRLGVAQVAARNIVYRKCRPWCEKMLIIFFNDSSDDIRKEAAHSFSHLWHAPDIMLNEYESLIALFLKSPAFVDDPTYLVHALEDSRERLPDLTYSVCETFIDRCGEQARDIRTGIAADERTIGNLVFRLYAQAESGESQSRSLRLIDKMCEEGFATTFKNLTEYDR
jgi:hypothetical protein